MRNFRDNLPIVSPGFYVLLAAYVMLLPIPWIAAWFVATMVHELGHYIALRICKVKVLSFSLDISGAQIRTVPMEPAIEAFAAVAGPLLGLSTLLFRHHFPRTAVCALIQSVFNLLPVYPWDGGRLLRCLVWLCTSGSNADRIYGWIEITALMLLFFLAGVISVSMDLGILPVAVWLVILLKSGKIKIPCKPRQQIVQ